MALLEVHLFFLRGYVLSVLEFLRVALTRIPEW